MSVAVGSRARGRARGSGSAVPAASRRLALLGVAVGLGLVLALDLARGNEYWDYSEGVYVLTSHLLLHGGDLYGDVVGAQPPGVYLAGAGLLAVHDGLLWVRVAVGLAQLATGALAGVLTWRLTGSRVAFAAPALALLLPWAVHEHGALTPEPLGGLLVMAAAVLAAARRPVPAALLAAAAVACKLPFALPAAAVLLAAPRARRSLTVWVAALVVEATAFGLAFGAGLWRDAVVAQLHSGRLPLHTLAGMWAQAVWSLSGLVVAAGLALALRRRARERTLLRVVVALAVGWIATLLTNAKNGTGLNVLVPVETALLPLALAGIAWALQASHERRGVSRRAVASGPLALAIGGLAFVLLQSAVLLAVPQRTAPPFLYPTSQRGAWGRVAPAPQVDGAVAAARRCPVGVPYGGPPLLAFLAGRQMPGGQPDGFLPRTSSTLRDVGTRIAEASPTCPGGGDPFRGPFGG